MRNDWPACVLACPACRAPLLVEAAISCDRCGFRSDNGKDLRATHAGALELRLPRLSAEAVEASLSAIQIGRPKVAFHSPHAARNADEFLAVILDRVPPGGAVLDVGCGPRDQAKVLEDLGYRYVGVDYSNTAADYLADAHALPFADETFDCVFAYAVLEHLHSPLVALDEIARVLKPGGTFVGAVSQGEPFHQSFFHMTAWGVVSLVQANGRLSIERLWPSEDTLRALSVMGRYPRLIRALVAAVEGVHRRLPWLAPRRMLWPAREKAVDELHRAGGICFAMSRGEGLFVGEPRLDRRARGPP